MAVEVGKDGQILRARGDSDNEYYHGYSCRKGRDHVQMYAHPERLIQHVKRTSDVTTGIDLETAIAEIATMISSVIGRYGPRAVAMYTGTAFALDHPANRIVAAALMDALGSPMYFTAGTIDQPGKLIARELHGTWMAPGYGLDRPDVALIVGNNPLISHQGRAGHPGDFFKDLRERSATLIVIDPRRSETARRASIHLQPRPGYDAVILASMLNVILLLDDSIDRNFVKSNADGVVALCDAVRPFSPDVVATLVGVDADNIEKAARAYAAGQRGFACAGTGPNMAGSGTLVEYLLLCMETVCGHWQRAGASVQAVPALLPWRGARAQVATAVDRPLHMLRVRNLTCTAAGFPTAVLSDEILLGGDQQVRVLLSVGGAPVTAWPDQNKTLRALQTLELFVHTDIQMSPSARLADYVIATTLPYEMAGTTFMHDYVRSFTNGRGPAVSYAQYSSPVVAPPNDELVPQWLFLWKLAQHLGLRLRLRADATSNSVVELDMATTPTEDELLEIVHRGSRIPLDVVRAVEGGQIFGTHALSVEPAEAGSTSRLQLADRQMIAELGEWAARLAESPIVSEFPLRLVSRRSPRLSNTVTPVVQAGGPPHNPLYMHPVDLEIIGCRSGDEVIVHSQHGSIPAIVEADESMRQGVVSMTHGYGDIAARDDEFREIGSCTNRLIANDVAFERHSGQPQMSAVPVLIVRQ